MNQELIKYFQEVENTLYQAIKSIPIPNGKIYACGFWLFYSDYSVIRCPCFAYNTIENDKDLESKWSPPNWIQSSDPIVENAVYSIYEKIDKYMTGKSHVFWELLFEFHYIVFANICKNIMRNSLLENWNTSEDFVVGIFEEREGAEIYNRLVIESIGLEKSKEMNILITLQQGIAPEPVLDDIYRPNYIEFKKAFYDMPKNIEVNK